MEDRPIGSAEPVQVDPTLLRNDPIPAAAPQPSEPQPVYPAQQPVYGQPAYPNPPMYGQPMPQRGFVPQQQFKYCQFCGAPIPAEAVVCTACGRQVAQLQQPVYSQPVIINNVPAYPQGRRKSKSTALLLCFFLGWLGIHRFYEGKILTGLLWMFTFGLFGLGEFIDFIILLCKPNPYYV